VETGTVGNRPRIAGIDTFRLLAVFLVVWIHCRPLLLSPQLHSLASIIMLQARFLMAFLFMAAGFFFARSVSPDFPPMAAFRRYGVRFLVPFFFWSLFYTFFSYGWTWQWMKDKNTMLFLSEGAARVNYAVLSDPVSFLLQENSRLWFIASLLTGIFLYSLFRQFKKERLFLLLSSGLFILGLLAGAYRVTPIGLHWDFNTRNGPFFSCLFIALGAWLAGRPAFSARTAFVLLFGGAALHLAEGFFLWKLYHLRIWSIDYLFSTMIYGMGIFTTALAFPGLGAGTPLPAWARLTFGIYVTHELIENLAGPSRPWLPFHALDDIVFTLTVFTVAALFTALLSRIPGLRALVFLPSASKSA
jgi:surface polysaccharide O-acyltransferase-like enzyme